MVGHRDKEKRKLVASLVGAGSNRWQGITDKVRPPHAPTYSDCSSAATWTYWVTYGGGPDFLNGESWWVFEGGVSRGVSSSHRPGCFFSSLSPTRGCRLCSK